MVKLFPVLVSWLLCLTTHATVHDVSSYGAVPNDPLRNVSNTDAFNEACAAAGPDDTVLLPYGTSGDGVPHTYHFTGGMVCANKTGLTLRLEANMLAADNINELWPDDTSNGLHYANWLTIECVMPTRAHTHTT